MPLYRLLLFGLFFAVHFSYISLIISLLSYFSAVMCKGMASWVCLCTGTLTRVKQQKQHHTDLPFFVSGRAVPNGF